MSNFTGVTLLLLQGVFVLGGLVRLKGAALEVGLVASWCYVGQRRNPEKDEWMCSVE